MRRLFSELCFHGNPGAPISVPVEKLELDLGVGSESQGRRTPYCIERHRETTSRGSRPYIRWNYATLRPGGTLRRRNARP